MLSSLCLLFFQKVLLLIQQQPPAQKYLNFIFFVLYLTQIGKPKYTLIFAQTKLFAKCIYYIFFASANEIYLDGGVSITSLAIDISTLFFANVISWRIK